jgi:tetratricopeptide (TPR) repeat protein
LEEKNNAEESKEKKNPNETKTIISLLVLLLIVVVLGPGVAIALITALFLPGLLLLGTFLMFVFILAPEVFTSLKRNRSLEKKCWSYINNSFYERVMELDNSIDEAEKSPSIYACIGTAYYNTGNLELALQNFKKAEEKLEESIYSYKNLKLDIRIYTHIAEILHKMGNYDESIKYYTKALEKASDKDDRMDILMKIAEIHEERNDLDNAIKYYQDAFIYYCDTCYKEKIAIYRKLAELYKKKDDESQTKRYLDKVFELEQKINQIN